MRQNRSAEIIDYLEQNKGKSFSADELSARFGLSARQIRNYIRQINEKDELILCSRNRYQLKSSPAAEKRRSYDSKERVTFIISRLLSAKEAVDLYNLAEELFVSDATIQSDLKKVRRRIGPFDLTLKNESSGLSIVGSEANKRSLASYTISNTHYRGFMSDDASRFFDDDYQIETLKKNLTDIFNECSFFYNDYSLNNIILHLVITIDRLRNSFSIEEAQMPLQISSIEKDAAERIVAFLEDTYEISINQIEKNNIAAFLATNLATLDYKMVNRDNISSYIDLPVIELVQYLLDQISDYYLIGPFDDVFFARFSLHIDNLLKRQKISHSVHNPMLMDIKMTYPLIFDTAVYAAGLIEEKTGYRINQDEISLIALHIGSFIESCDSNKNKLTAIYIYSDYHQFYQHNIARIQNRFDDQINLLYTITADDYNSKTMKPDLLISEIPMPDAISVSAFITPAQIENIESLLKLREKEKDKQNFFASLQQLFREDLFFRNIYGGDEFEVIGKLTDRLKDKDLFKEEFVESVMNREKLSSTCFIKRVAIPHAIGQMVSQSFISIVTYEHGQKWGSEEIELLILFGIAYTQRKDFRYVFNQVIDVLSNEANVNALCRCRSYDEIIDVISQGLFQV